MFNHGVSADSLTRGCSCPNREPGEVPIDLFAGRLELVGKPVGDGPVLIDFGLLRVDCVSLAGFAGGLIGRGVVRVVVFVVPANIGVPTVARLNVGLFPVIYRGGEILSLVAKAVNGWSRSGRTKLVPSAVSATSDDMQHRTSEAIIWSIVRVMVRGSFRFG